MSTDLEKEAEEWAEEADCVGAMEAYLEIGRAHV